MAIMQPQVERAKPMDRSVVIAEPTMSYRAFVCALIEKWVREIVTGAAARMGASRASQLVQMASIKNRSGRPTESACQSTLTGWADTSQHIILLANGALRSLQVGGANLPTPRARFLAMN